MCSDRLSTAIAADGASWLTEWPTRIAPMADLICFPGAGAGASAYRTWASRLPPFTAVLACQLPGREKRIDEPPASSLASAADGVVAAYLAIRPVSRPVVLFGHSMGGTLAFEVARRLVVAGRAASALVLSASAPPTVVRKNAVADDGALRDLLIGYDPNNRKITGNEELFTALAPVLSSDIAMLRRHVIPPGTPLLDVSVHLMNGRADAIVPGVSVARWAEYFSGAITCHELEGGHFFPFRESQDRVLALIAGILREMVARRKLA
jgi:surfactin synthase thioesterase subunit